MKVVLSADGTDEGMAACQWCVANLRAGDAVSVVAGLNQFGEFVLGVPPFDVMGGERELLAELERECCDPLARVGLVCRAQVVRHGQVRALLEVAEAEGASLIVVGKRPHGPVADAMLRDVASQVLHHPPCPVLVVPTMARAARSPAGRSG